LRTASPFPPAATMRPARVWPWAIDFVLLAALWGGSFLFMHLGAAQFGAIPTAGLRVGIAALALSPLWLQPRQRAALRGRWRAVMFVGVLNSALPFALFSYAVLSLPTGLTSVLNATTPLFGALVAWAWLGERPGRLRLCGLALGFTGVALLAGRGARLDAAVAGWPVLACLGATCSYGCAASFARRYLAGVPPAASVAGAMLGAALALAGPTAWYWPAHMPGWPAWLAVVALGVLCSALAYFLYFRLIERAGPSRALAVTFLVPVFGLAYGAVLLGEAVTPGMLACGVVILAGTLLASGLASRWPARETMR
jgi:drug/metabolite transporter (DMT)-like permease